MQSNFRLNKLQLLALLTLLFATAFAMAQGIVTGSISGTVEDAQGAVVTNAKITAKEVSTNRVYSGETGSAGIFTLRALPPGTYTVTIEAPNFRKYENKGVTVSVGSEAGLGRIKMEVGASSETLTVEGTPPLVETGTQQITATFDSQQARDLPVGNSLDSLALFIPGVASAGDTGFSNNNGAEISVNGQRARSNNFQIDGQANNDNSIGGPSFFFGNQDAIAELQVVTNYSAEYGRNMGAVVNYVTKQGTNAFHGSGYELFNGSTFDSLTNQSKSAVFGWCQPGQTPEKDGCAATFVPRVVDNRFGGTLGGPVLKDKMWFFGSTHFQRQRFGASPSNSGGLFLPTPNGIQQLQTAYPGNAAVSVLAAIGPSAVKAGNPQYGDLQTPFVTTVIDPITGTFQDCSKVPTPAGCFPIEFGTVSRFIPSLFNDREISGRVDLKVTNKDNFFGRYIFQQFLSTGVSGGSIAVGNYVDVPGRSQQIGLEWDRYWSTTFTNSARFSFSRAGFGFEGGAFPSCTRSNINNCPTNISIGDGFTAGFGLATNLPQGRLINNYQLQDNASWQVGKMTIKLGGEYGKQRSPNVFLPTTNGQYVYGDFNSFLADDPAFINAALGNPKEVFKENDLAFYVQNDWRIKDNLTLNLGLRWEWFQQAVNLLHDSSLAQQTGSSPFWDPTLDLSRTTIPYIPQDLNNFSPVVGFAWTPRVMRKFMGEDKTVIRAGFRIGYDPSFYNIFLNTGTSAPVVNITSAFGPGPGFLPPSGIGSDVQALVQPLLPVGSDPGLRRQVLVSRNFHNPYSEQWNLGIERSFGGSQRLVAEVRYIGSHTVGNFQSVNANPALKLLIDNGFSDLIPAGLTPCSDSTQPGFSRGFVDCTKTRVLQRQNSAFATYHSLQTNLRTANWHGITSTASYTFSKALDNATEIFSNIAGGTTLAFAQNPFSAGKGEKAVSGIDFPHNFSLALIYDLPFYKSQHGITGKVLGGWQLNTTYRYLTGQPYSTIQSRFAGIGTSFCDPRATLSGFFDACRPILSNPAAAIDSIGICDPDSEGCSLLNWVDFENDIFTPVSASDVRWIVNDHTAAFASGSPFLGAGRNSLRGQNISTANLALFKNAKLTEKVTLQFRATAYNVMNHQFLGVPDPLLDDAFVGTFQSRNFNSNGGSSSNVLFDGLGQRRLELGLKILF